MDVRRPLRGPSPRRDAALGRTRLTPYPNLRRTPDYSTPGGGPPLAPGAGVRPAVHAGIVGDQLRTVYWGVLYGPAAGPRTGRLVGQWAILADSSVTILRSCGRYRPSGSVGPDGCVDAGSDGGSVASLLCCGLFSG